MALALRLFEDSLRGKLDTQECVQFFEGVCKLLTRPCDHDACGKWVATRDDESMLTLAIRSIVLRAKKELGEDHSRASQEMNALRDSVAESIPPPHVLGWSEAQNAKWNPNWGNGYELDRGRDVQKFKKHATLMQDWLRAKAHQTKRAPDSSLNARHRYHQWSLVLSVLEDEKRVIVEKTHQYPDIRVNGQLLPEWMVASFTPSQRPAG